MNARLGAELLVALALPCSILQAQTGGTCVPVAQRGDRTLGCYITARQSLGPLPADAVLYWHIDSFPTLAAAEAARSGRATAVSSLGTAWLFTLADSAWHSTAGHHVAIIGPVPVVTADSLAAVYMEGVFEPGMKTVVHRHAGAEAWYTLVGSAMPRDTARQARAASGRARHDSPGWGADDAGRHRQHRASLAGADPPGREPAEVDTGNGLGAGRPVRLLKARPATGYCAGV